MPWRRKWQPTPVFLPRKSHGQRSLVGYSPWGRKESDTTELLHRALKDVYQHFQALPLEVSSTTIPVARTKHCQVPRLLLRTAAKQDHLSCYPVHELLFIITQHRAVCPTRTEAKKYQNIGAWSRERSTAGPCKKSGS